MSRGGGRDRVADRVTVLIKTFERPRTVEGAIASVRRFYPSLPIVVADDSRHPMDDRRADVRVHHLPFDSGTGRGRNYLVRQVQTEYFLMMDDDHRFTRDTRLERMIGILEAEAFDILGCLVFEPASWVRAPRRRWRRILDFQMDVSLEGGVLRFTEPASCRGGGPIRCDIVQQFFLARTEAVRRAGGWDDRLKTSDHTDFFLRMKKAGVKVGFTPLVAAMHDGVYAERRARSYAPFRYKRAWEFHRVWVEAHGIETLVGRNGTVLSAAQFVQDPAGSTPLGNLVFRPALPGLVLWHRVRAALAGPFAHRRGRPCAGGCPAAARPHGAARRADTPPGGP